MGWDRPDIRRLILCREELGENMNVLIFVIISVFMGSFGQISLKHGMNQVKVIGMHEILKNLFKVFLNFFILFGIALYALSSILWLFSMTKLDISFMYPLVSLSYLITAIFAIIFLKEKVIMKRWIGLILIIAGSFFIMFA